MPIGDKILPIDESMKFPELKLKKKDSKCYKGKIENSEKNSIRKNDNNILVYFK